MSSFRVRRADETDMPVLLTLAEEFMPKEATREKRIEILRQALKHPDYEMLVAELDGEIAGFIDQWIIHDFAHGAKLSFIQNLYVISKHRRGGVGNKLLEEIVESGKDKGVLEIHVVTEFGNKPAINLYKKHGLVKESSTRDGAWIEQLRHDGWGHWSHLGFPLRYSVRNPAN